MRLATTGDASVPSPRPPNPRPYGFTSASLQSLGKLNKVLHHLGIAHGVYADGFLQRDTHENLFHRHFQFFTAQCARHFGYGEDLVGDVMWREAGTNPGAYSVLERVIQRDTGLEYDKEGHIVSAARTL